MEHRNYAQDINQGGLSSQAGASPPEVPALEGFRRQADRIHGYLMELHEMADRSCGLRPPLPETNAPACSPNGLLDQVQAELGGLEQSASALVARMRRIAG